MSLDDKRDDFLHHRASGLNQVLCKLMHDKGSFMAFNFNNILNSEDIFCSKILGRIQQNISLCRKFKVPMIVFSFAKHPFEMRSPQDLRSFFLDLGMHPKEFSDGFSVLQILCANGHLDSNKQPIGGFIKFGGAPGNDNKFFFEPLMLGVAFMSA